MEKRCAFKYISRLVGEAMSKLDDHDIRKIVLEHVRKFKDVKVREEYTTYSGKSRADIVAINSHFNAFEIKSDYDSLGRLPNQIKEYDLTFEKNYIVTGNKYINKISNFVPQHWGIIHVYKRNNNIVFKYCRRPILNPYFDFKCFLGLIDSQTLKKMVMKSNIKTGINSKEIRGSFKYPLLEKLDNNLSDYQKQKLIKSAREVIKAKMKSD